MANEAIKFVWEGAIPLQIHLHKSEVASHPAPSPALVSPSICPSEIPAFLATFASIRWW